MNVAPSCFLFLIGCLKNRNRFCLNRFSNWSALASIIAALALVTGCAHTVSFKVVDANSHAPLANVSVKWVKISSGWFLSIDTKTLELPNTTTNGSIKLTGVHESHNIHFNRDDYWPANVFVGKNKRVLITSPCPDKIKIGDSLEFTDNANMGLPIVVELHPKTGD